MTNKLFDGKSRIGYAFWNTVNRLVVRFHFQSIQITGASKIPKDRPFILVANHSSRWDGPVVQYLLNRRANYMVSPNEIKGIQKPAVLSVGAFPANPRLDLVGYSIGQLQREEPVVVFPEGNVFYDGKLRRFKGGTAKIVLNAKRIGVDVEVIPVVIKYSFGRTNQVKIHVGDSIKASSSVDDLTNNFRVCASEFTESMYTSVKSMYYSEKLLCQSRESQLVSA